VIAQTGRSGQRSGRKSIQGGARSKFVHIVHIVHIVHVVHVVHIVHSVQSPAAAIYIVLSVQSMQISMRKNMDSDYVISIVQ